MVILFSWDKSDEVQPLFERFKVTEANIFEFFEQLQDEVEIFLEQSFIFIIICLGKLEVNFIHPKVAHFNEMIGVLCGHIFSEEFVLWLHDLLLGSWSWGDQVGNQDALTVFLQIVQFCSQRTSTSRRWSTNTICIITIFIHHHCFCKKCSHITINILISALIILKIFRFFFNCT